MRTIAFVTQKGGSGKSTLASSLAVAAHEAGERVFIIDMDPQASLVKWSKARGEGGLHEAILGAGDSPRGHCTTGAVSPGSSSWRWAQRGAMPLRITCS